MGLSKLPTRGTADSDLGPEKKNNPLSAISRIFKIIAEEWNAATLAVYEMAQALGLGDGSTAGSIEAERLKNATEIGGALADGDTIAVADASASNVVRKALMSRVYDYLLAKIPIAWGTWTPTPVNLANFVSATSVVGRFIRIGPGVICWCRIAGSTLTAATTTDIGLAPPVPSALTGDDEAGGYVGGASATSGRIRVDAANDRLRAYFAASSTTPGDLSFIAGYWVI